MGNNSVLFFGKKEKSRFGDYDVLRLVHSGEKSSVFEALRPGSDRHVAVKLYTRSYERTAARLEKKYGIPSEAEVGLEINPAGQDQPRDIPIVATIREGREYNRRRGARYIVQEFVRGVNLKNLIACQDPELRRHAGSYAFQLCRALREVHRHDYVYRDFCSENVIVARGGDLTLIDLGFVAPVGMAFEERSGTPSYMSPEQIRAEPLGYESDIYSLGVVLYELLSGRLPFGSEFSRGDEQGRDKRRADLMRKHLQEHPPDIPEKVRNRAPALSRVVPRCLAKDPEDRYSSIDELMSALA
jgi:serine/threonine-protein kinase